MTNSQQHERDVLYSQIENGYGSVVYSHAAQEEQRTRLPRTEHRIKVAQIVLSALSAAGLVGVFFPLQIWIASITAVITFFLLVLNSYSFRLEIGAKAARHRKAGDQLWLLIRKYLSLLVDFPELDIAEARKRRDVLIAETAEAYCNAERTDDKSFSTAQKPLKEDGLK
ncbi:SLATT domain-containing protein [Corynebacterium amycolatum]|uniref:SLATT domain-containing protein n=1 Tax=Corynebacterium amycolatum TaxID=43765 RepID=UPI001245C5DE|nr:SLATT domain-containing protein [Corynebacterium amycolatum]KAA9222814.1 SLATT domain-containing protein [Corynebacterium amycolatum]MDK7199131.1 SLATT domain-containing protein [Corynebacterium amycolatum]